MNTAIARRTFREYLLMGVGTAVLLATFMVIFVVATHSIPIEQGRDWLSIDWIRGFISAILGADALELLSSTGLISFAFTHPVAWMLILSFPFAVTSGVISGQIDRGNMDLVATLPLSRTHIYVSHTVAALCWGPVHCGSLVGGALIGMAIARDASVSVLSLLLVACHLMAAYTFIVCIGMATSAFASRRSTALTVCFVYIFYAFLVNLVAAFWPVGERLSFTSFLHYYRPLLGARTMRFQWGDMGVLLTAGAMFWVAGIWRFRTRDIPAR